MAQGSGPDFFISYTASDVSWAEWIAVTLERAGYTVSFQEWDFYPGSDFVHLMHQATQESNRMIAVQSQKYFTSGFGETEWLAAFAHDPLGKKGLLLPVRVEPCQPPGLLASQIFVDLTNTSDETSARDVLLAGVENQMRSRPTRASFPAKFPSEALEPYPYPGKIPVTDTSASTAPERTPWEWLRRHRPRIATLEQQDDVLGHRDVKKAIRSRINNFDTGALVLLAGPPGSGKSALLTGWLKQVAGDRVIDAGKYAERLNRPLRADGTDVSRLLHGLGPAIKAAGIHAVLLYDDVDHVLKEPGISRLVQEAVAQLNLGYLVLTTSTPLTPQLFPIPATELVLDHRQTEPEEFERFVEKVLDAAGCTGRVLSRDLRRSLYEMSESTSNFGAVHYVLEMLIAHHRWTGAVTYSSVLKQLLDSDPQAHRLELPAVRSTRGPHLSFRIRDKSELLAQLILRHFPTAQVLANAAENRLEGFDAKDFLDQAKRSFLDAIVSLCLTNSPRDIILLLGSEAIRKEINERRLDPEELFDEGNEEASLLVRGLGFTLVDAPKGLRHYKAAITVARELVEDDEQRPQNVLNAAGKTVALHLHSAFLDLLHFWATYLFGSVNDLVRAARSQNAAIGGEPFDTRRLVELFAFINKSAQEETSSYRLSFTDYSVPISATLLKAAEGSVTAIEAFTEPPGSTSVGPNASLRTRVENLVVAADNVMRVSDSSFPAVIKLTEIVFDEYSRKIYRGVDSDGEDIRFAITSDDDREELVVAAHYFMLPKKRVSVNPHIVPRGGSQTTVLFDGASAYDARSSTQRQQAERLLELVNLESEESVVDVGCGTGALTIAIAQWVRQVHGIDQSAEMVRTAQRRARVARVDNVTFEVVDLLEYEAREAFDVVVSNATMHWAVPADRTYQRLFRLLRRGGRLGVHQGGYGNYRGLHAYTRALLKDLELWEYYVGWTYPVYYPTVDQYRELLRSVGFDFIQVESVASDGSEYPNLIQDFSEAGLLPYLRRLPEARRASLRMAWLEDAEYSDVDRYTHLLYATALRP